MYTMWYVAQNNNFFYIFIHKNGLKYKWLIKFYRDFWKKHIFCYLKYNHNF